MNPAFQVTAAFSPEIGALPAGDSPSVARGWVSRLLRHVQPTPADAVDRSTGLLNRGALFAAVAEHLGSCRDAGGISALVLEFSDLPEVRDIYGAGVARKVVAKVVRRLRAAAGLRGWIARTGATEFTIVFPGVDGGKAAKRLHRALGTPPRVEFDAGDSEIVLVPDFVVDTMAAGAGCVQDLYRDMVRELSRMREVERRRLHLLASERERHSRPMAVGS